MSSHSDMVLQRAMPLPIWGWADPGETVTCEIAGAKATATANAEGQWKLELPAMKAGGPYELTISGHNKVKLTGVLVGEVWVCSGQSNMEMGIGMCKDGKQEIAAATNSANPPVSGSQKDLGDPSQRRGCYLESLQPDQHRPGRLGWLFGSRLLFRP